MKTGDIMSQTKNYFEENATNSDPYGYSVKTTLPDPRQDSNFVNLTTAEDELFDKLMRSNGIYSKGDLDWNNTFYRFPRNDPYNFLGPTKEYVFFTKPDLHIFSSNDTSVLNSELENIPIFVDMMNRGYNKTVLRDLQYSSDTSTPFIRLLSNAKSSNIELSPINVDDTETASNMYGTKMFYRKASDRSDEEADFSIEFSDSKWLEVYLWFKLFDIYEQRKYEGKITPPRQWYIEHKVLHDQMTIFKFIVGEDGETIVHYSRKQGCYPKSVPREAFSDPSSDGGLRFSTQWKCTFQDDSDPIILAHFNKLSQSISAQGELVPLWDSTISGISGENVEQPFIYTQSNTINIYKTYKLLWRK